MIARIWHGAVPVEKSETYLDNQREHGIGDYLATEGNRGVFIMTRTENGLSHFLLLTLWDSMESIKQFAGEEVEKARYYPDDRKYLIELEPNVQHYDVLVEGLRLAE